MKNVVVIKLKKELCKDCIVLDYDEILDLDYDEILDLDDVEVVYRRTVEDFEISDYNCEVISEEMLYDLPEDVVDVYDSYIALDDSEEYTLLLFAVTSTDPYDEDCEYLDYIDREWF